MKFLVNIFILGCILGLTSGQSVPKTHHFACNRIELGRGQAVDLEVKITYKCPINDTPTREPCDYETIRKNVNNGQIGAPTRVTSRGRQCTGGVDWCRQSCKTVGGSGCESLRGFLRDRSGDPTPSTNCVKDVLNLG